MENVNQVERFVRWLEDNVMYIAFVAGVLMFMVEKLETIHFVMFMILTVVSYTLYIIYEKRKHLEKADVLIR